MELTAIKDLEVIRFYELVGENQVYSQNFYLLNEVCRLWVATENKDSLGL